MAKKKQRGEKYGCEASGIFVPGGLLLGLGLGFLYNNVPAGLFIGLGSGFILMAIFRMLLCGPKKK